MSIFFAMNREDEEATTLLPSFFLSSYRSGKKLETNFEDIVKKNRRKTKDRIGERSKKKKKKVVKGTQKDGMTAEQRMEINR